MRAQNFLNTLLAAHGANAANLNLARAATLAQNANLRGGWEVWLQVEIAQCLMTYQANWACVREAPYPSFNNALNPYLTYGAGVGAGVTANANAAARCDFFLRRAVPNAIADDTYLELKVISAAAANPLNDAWGRFAADINKQAALAGLNNTLNCISLLATFGTFNPGDVAGPNPSLAWCWAGGRSAYVFDPTNAAVTTLQNVSQGGGNRLFLVAVSV